MRERPTAAIVDYGLGNLYSVATACKRAGMEPSITSSAADLEKADCVILPGVGAFGSAMEQLGKLDLISPLQALARSDKPLVGICLGVQLLMTESHEFGRHAGLGLVEGPVVSINSLSASPLKVPHIGWSRVQRSGRAPDPLLENISDGEYMYFVHSFVVRPADPQVVVATTRYHEVEFCSALQVGNVHAFQFHPERSGRRGLEVYANLARLVERKRRGVTSQ